MESSYGSLRGLAMGGGIGEGRVYLVAFACPPSPQGTVSVAAAHSPPLPCGLPGCALGSSESS